MRILASLLWLPCLASALTLTRVSTPKDGSTPLTLADATRLYDGTWVVQDDEDNFWYSADKGATWKSIPASPAGGVSDIMGDALVDRSNDRLWTSAKGWHMMTFPASWSVGSPLITYAGSEGIQAKMVGTTVRYYTTADGWETWSELLTHDASASPDDVDPLGEYAAGKIWFFPEDSGYGRGTADGRTWTRIATPSFRPWLLTSEGTGTILSTFGMDMETMKGNAAYSLDGGKSWIEGPLDRPGSMIVAAENGAFVSVAENSERVMEMWMSPRIDMGWERVGEIQGFFFEAKAAHVALADGIYRVDNLGTAVQRSTPRSSARVVRQNGVLTLLSDASLLGSPWVLLSTDGSRVASGTISGSHQSLPGHVTAGWIRIGERVLPLTGL